MKSKHRVNLSFIPLIELILRTSTTVSNEITLKQRIRSDLMSSKMRQKGQVWRQETGRSHKLFMKYHFLVTTTQVRGDSSPTPSPSLQVRRKRVGNKRVSVRHDTLKVFWVFKKEKENLIRHCYGQKSGTGLNHLPIRLPCVEHQS